VQQSATDRSGYDTAAARLKQSLAYIAAPLARLTPEQKASVAALLIATRVTTEDQLLHPKGGGALQAIWPDLQDICPPLKSVSFSRGGCLDAEIAYASAMAKCEKDGKRPDQCEIEAAPEAAAAMDCQLKAFQALPGIIHGLPGRAWPPRPFPWTDFAVRR
jgi:hypothetical protein